jgi:hypothetical protein
MIQAAEEVQTAFLKGLAVGTVEGNLAGGRWALGFGNPKTRLVLHFGSKATA